MYLVFEQSFISVAITTVCQILLISDYSYSHVVTQFPCKSVPSNMFDNLLLQYRVHSPPTTNVMESTSAIRIPVRQREQLWTVTIHGAIL